MRAGRDRREADGRQRREDGRRARVRSRARASSASVGALRRSTAASNIAGVSPSMTIRTTFLVAGEDAQAGVALPLPSRAARRPQAGTASASRYPTTGTKASAARTSAATRDEHRRPAACRRGAARPRDRRSRRARRAHRRRRRRSPRASRRAAEPITTPTADSTSGSDEPEHVRRSTPASEHAERDTEARADADPVPAAHRVQCS